MKCNSNAFRFTRQLSHLYLNLKAASFPISQRRELKLRGAVTCPGAA